MRKIIVTFMVLAGAVALTGCKDHSKDIEELESQIAAQQKRLDTKETELRDENVKLRDRIDELEKRLGERGPDAASIADEIKQLRTDMASGNTKETDAKIDALEKRLDTFKDDVVTEAKSEAEKAVAGAMLDEDKIAEIAAKKLADEQAKNAPTKNLEQAMARLDISQAEKDAIRQHVIDSKKEMLDLLDTPTEDGRNFGEEIIDTFLKIQNGKADNTAILTIFGEMSNTIIPGDPGGRTYSQAIDEIKKKNKENIGRILSEEDQNALTRAHEDWTDFEVGEDDPWSALYMERLEKYNEENPPEEKTD